ncbi:SigE family RNA polymerase sigma factor [Cryptosporangium sp. NPDC051539]|uniref:SigE family RNA polymerase sigma factor n=1 Tax=Cryptosporangium sp. NPDC051539 TaxID=3363962 RepID=UPI00378A0FAC
MIARGYQREFEEFVRDSSDRLVRTAYLLCGDRGHAEDMTQTALLRTARRWRSARTSPEAYARRVVVNLAKDRWRALSRRPPETGLEVDVPIATDGPADADDRLLRAVRTLPDGQQAVLVLRFFDDLSVAETAAALGCSDGTVKSQTARALERLRSIYAPEREHR